MFVLVVCRNSKILKKTRKHNKTQFWITSIVVCYDFEEKIEKIEKSDFLLFDEILYKIQKIKKIKQNLIKKHNCSCVLLDFWLKIKENTKQHM